ncbi:DUF4232 domain-containing protein [Streptomyces sp. NPDC090025]|uniref:DUF4232 domain-containing protein n=1 Tax=Streptomyces sp. NPDC090025 TaxID=3365922 RepID=UPI0038323739
MRITARRLALPVAALAASLALTACQSSDSPKAAPKQVAEAPTSAAPAPEPSSAAPTKPAPAKPSASASASAEPAAKPSTTPAKPAAHKPVKPVKPAKPGTSGQDDGPVETLCTIADTKIVASKVSRPINHVVLTVTNVSKRPCNVMNAPFVGFDEPQATIGIMEDSKPQAVVTLFPGYSGYASIKLTGEPGGDTNGRTIKKIRVNLTREIGTTIPAPAGTYADDNAEVSYWQFSLADALVY